MKRLVIIFIMMLFSFCSSFGQEAVATSNRNPVFLFEDFTPSVIRIREKVVRGVMVNYDINNQKLYYVDGEHVMEMTNSRDLDTLYAADSRFVWKNGSLCEYIPEDYGSVYVKREIRKFSDIENIYYLVCNDREYTVRYLSDLYEQFPEKASETKNMVREYGLSMADVDGACKIFRFVCSGTLPQFTYKDLIGYWCLDMEYNREPHRLIHFIDGSTAVIYSETGVVNLFHNTVGLQVPGFNGLFYCPQHNSTYGYSLTNEAVSISNGMTLKITKKGLLKVEGTSVLYRKFEQRTFSEVVPPLNSRYGNPERSEWNPVPGLSVYDPNPR